MTLLHRRIVYITFIIIFLIVAPLVVLYTSGYRYNLQKGRVQKTGILMLSSIPRDAEIWLNGKKVDKKTTPVRLEYILPGDYEIQFKKSGYYDWNKKLPVFENSTTFAEKVILWKQSHAEVMSTSTISYWTPSSDKRKVAFLADTSSLMFLEVGGDLTDIISANPIGLNQVADLKGYWQIKIIGWSPDNKKILLSTGDSASVYLVINTLNKKIEKIDKQFKNIKWNEAGDLLYATDQLGFWQINPSGNEQRLLFKGFLPDDFLPADGRIYYLQNQSLWSKNLASGRSDIVASPLKCTHCRITKKINNRFIIQGPSSEMYIINPDNRQNDIGNIAKELYWLDDNSLLFYNDWEIYIYNFNKKDPELITRLGQPINSALWHPKGKHLIFFSDNKIQIVELDNRELRNIVDVLDNGTAYNMAISRDGKNLYFSGQASSTVGIYKLNLQ